MLIPDPRRTPLPNLISHNGIILYQWEFLRARLDEGEGLPWIAMDELEAKSGLTDSRAPRSLPLHVCYASQYKQKVYRSAYSSTCTRALRTLVTGTELAEFRHPSHK